jgi:hypothetical protein
MLANLHGRSARLIVALLLPFTLAIGGCATTQQKPISDWHDAVLAVQTQSTTTFSGVNDLVREAQIQRAANLSTLDESAFQAALDPKSLAIWDGAFDALAKYSAALTTLLSPDLSAGVGASTKQLGESIATTARSNVLKDTPGLSTALGSLGEKLTSTVASGKAKDVMAESDATVARILGQMSRMICDDSGARPTGVCATVNTVWTTKIDAIGVEFLRAQSADDKRSVATRYAAALQGRDTANAALMGFRASLSELAAAHSRAAAGGSMDTAALIANIREQTAFFKALLTDLKPAQN